MYIYGKNVVREKLNSNDKIFRAYVSKKFRDNDLINELRDRGVKINFVNDVVLDNKVKGNHQGIVLDVDDVYVYSIDEFLNSIDINNNSTVVILDHLEDPHNFGAIIRTCEALGIDGIIYPNDRSVGVTSSVVRTSVGAIEYVKLVRVVNINNAINKLKDNGFWIYGTDMNGDDYNSVNFDCPVCLIIGNEGKGISNVVRKNCDYIISIPMRGKINSLNASVSAGILLEHISRRNING